VGECGGKPYVMTTDMMAEYNIMSEDDYTTHTYQAFSIFCQAKHTFFKKGLTCMVK